jgi:hypothetical protein
MDARRDYARVRLHGRQERPAYDPAPSPATGPWRYAFRALFLKQTYVKQTYVGLVDQALACTARTGVRSSRLAAQAIKVATTSGSH